jgi:hypothetical protein
MGFAKEFWTPLTFRAYVNYVGKCGNMWENLETCENMSERAVIYGILWDRMGIQLWYDL